MVTNKAIPYQKSVSESQSVLELVLLIEVSTSFNLKELPWVGLQPTN